MSKSLNNYYSQGKSDSHYTMYFYNFSKDKLLTFLKDKMEKLNKNIKDNYKRKKANDSIYNLISNIENNKIEIFNHIILMNDGKINYIELDTDDLMTLKSWSLNDYFFDYDSEYKIDYLMELFSESLKIINFHFDNNNVSIYKVDKHKKCLIEKIKLSNIEEYLDGFGKDYCKIFSGKSSYLKNKSIENQIKDNSIENIINFYEDLIEEENTDNFNKFIVSNLTNEKINHKFIFGKKETMQNIKNSMIETLFIEKEILERLKQKLSQTNNLDLINFKIICFKNKKILKDFDGVVGIKYY